MRTFLALVREAVLSLARDRAALFFTYALPLMFLVVFALLFGDGGASKPAVRVVGEGPVLSALPSAALDIERTDDLAAAVAAVREGDATAAISQQGDTVRIDVAASDAVGSATVTGIVDAVVGRANLAAAGGTPRFRVEAAQVEDDDFGAIEFYVPGLLAYGISVSAVFALGLTLVQWRRSGLLRRLKLTPVTARDIGLAQATAAVLVAISQAVAFLLVGRFLFDVQLSGWWVLSIPLVVAGALAFMAIGFVVASFAKTQEAASAIGNAITLPMAFLGGAFIPLDVAPDWVESVARALPLYYLVEGLKDVMVRGQGPDAIVVPMTVLVAFALVTGAIGARLFRWS